ncbi:MAG: serine/threonine-protein kinase [Byssovorax sp.]
MSAEAKLPLAPGDLVAGKYEVDRVLGVGGMGAVFAAVDRATRERVALKCLLPIFCENVDVITRFLREGSATMRLQSEHIARVSATGALDSGVPYIVMEHLDGRDLRSVVRSSGPLDVKDAAGYVGQVCAALAEAHALGIVHRDLKPANLFLTLRPNGSALIKVLDFGIAKYTSPSLLGDHAEMTKTQAVLGSRAYMSPEQMLRPKEVDARADIWSLGVILYFFVTGKSPFSSDTTEGMIMRIVSGAPEPMTTLVPDLPPTFEAVVMRCLAKSREARFSNVTELARALAPFASDIQDRTTMTLDDAKSRSREGTAPESGGATQLGYTKSAPAASGAANGSLSEHGTSRTSVTPVKRRPLQPLMVTAGAVAIVGAAIVVGSFIVGARRAPDRDQAREGVKAVAVEAPPPSLSVAEPPVVVAVLEDPPLPEPLPAAASSVPVAHAALPAAHAPPPAAPAAPTQSVKPSLVKTSGSKPTTKSKPPTPAADTPW